MYVFAFWQVSCVENLCDSLCYQLDLASFVACVNSGRTWSSKSSLLLSGKEDTTSMSENADLDPFVENFVLERLSAQSPLRVRPSLGAYQALNFLTVLQFPYSMEWSMEFGL